jgi:hypothetical protein
MSKSGLAICFAGLTLAAGSVAAAETPVELTCVFPEVQGETAGGNNVHIPVSTFTFTICATCRMSSDGLYAQYPNIVAGVWKISDTSYAVQQDFVDDSMPRRERTAFTISRDNGSAVYTFTNLLSGAWARSEGQCRKFEPHF